MQELHLLMNLSSSEFSQQLSATLPIGFSANLQLSQWLIIETEKILLIQCSQDSCSCWASSPGPTKNIIKPCIKLTWCFTCEPLSAHIFTYFGKTTNVTITHQFSRKSNPFTPIVQWEQAKAHLGRKAAAFEQLKEIRVPGSGSKLCVCVQMIAV